MPSLVITRLSKKPRHLALTVLLATLATAVALILFTVSRTTATGAPSVQGTGDSVTYLSIIEGMRAGSNYYDAAHEILLARNYGTRSVFNWRTPAWPVFLSILPSLKWAQGLLAALGLVAILMAYRMVRTDGGLLIAITTALSVAASLAGLAVSDSVVFAEVAAGTMILLSVVVYGNGWPLCGLVVAIVALFVRELVAPYVLLCVAFALSQKNRRELVGWTLGLIAYFGYFLWHWKAVAQQLGPSDRSYSEGWLQFGGLRFILDTAHFNGLFSVLPLWLTGLIIPFAMLGLFAWPKGTRAGLTAATYVFIFAIVGKPFNNYWGALYTPLLMLGLSWTVPAFRDALIVKKSNPFTA
jgi:hypothetical protein